MKKQTAILLLIIAAVAMAAVVTYKTILKTFLPVWEGFSSKPYWDYKQWSWGYGTKVPGSVADKNINPGGTITREQAFIDALQHIQGDYLYLKPMVKVPLSANQWAAFLSFSYNLGRGNADNLIPNINSKNFPALELQWKSYVNAGGVPLPSLINRRAAEWDLFVKS